jgi:hypothetical protein
MGESVHTAYTQWHSLCIYTVDATSMHILYCCTVPRKAGTMFTPSVLARDGADALNCNQTDC